MSEHIKTYKTDLTHEELVLLDGKVRNSVQEVIDLAKEENSIGFDFPLINEIIRNAKKAGKLTWSRKSIRYCSHCKQSAGYAKYTRNGRYHRKGEPNHKRPLTFSGFKFNPGFITIKRHGDCCATCEKKHKVIENAIGYIINNNLQIQLPAYTNRYVEGITSRWQKDPIRICFKCKKEAYESEMGKSRTLMNDGYYPSKCPHCKAESTPFGRSHKSTDKFRMIEIKIEIKKVPA